MSGPERPAWPEGRELVGASPASRIAPSDHLRWLRGLVPEQRLFAPRVAVVAMRDGLVAVEESGQLPAADVEMGSSIAATTAALLERRGIATDGPPQPLAVMTGRRWWEEHPELGPLQPLWVLVGVHPLARLDGPARAADELPFLGQPAGDPIRPAGLDASPDGPAAGDYIRTVRARVGTERIFYPWAGVALRDERGRVFLVRLRQAGQWHCPGGGLEVGETPEDAARREVDEETGLLVRPGGLVGCWSRLQRAFANGDRIQAVAVLLEGTIVGGAFRPDATGEIDRAGWFGPDDLPPLWPPWDARVRLVLTGQGSRLD